MKPISCPGCQEQIDEIKDGTCPLCGYQFSPYVVQAIEENIKKSKRSYNILVAIAAVVTIAFFAFAILVIPKYTKAGRAERQSLLDHINKTTKSAGYVQSDGKTSSSVTFSGSGIQSTRTFTVNGAWEAQWKAIDENPAFYLYNGTGEMVGVFGLTGKGSYYSAKGGIYYIETNALGSWEVKIVPVT